MIYTKIKIQIILILHFFSRINNKKVTKNGGRGTSLDFIYEVSIEVLTDPSATPGTSTDSRHNHLSIGDTRYCN